MVVCRCIWTIGVTSIGSLKVIIVKICQKWLAIIILKIYVNISVAIIIAIKSIFMPLNIIIN